MRLGPGSRIKDPVSCLVFSATVLSLAGVKIPEYMQGHAFAGPAQPCDGAARHAAAPLPQRRGDLDRLQ